jgi:hypothetical protein
MVTAEFLFQRSELLKKKEEHLKIINEIYTKIVKQFIDENSPVKNHKVYELIKNGKKRRGFKRFIIYTQEVSVFDKTDIFIRVGGWWLDNENTPTKWDTMTVMGVSNSAEFVLSENQINKKHPYSK